MFLTEKISVWALNIFPWAFIYSLNRAAFASPSNSLQTRADTTRGRILPLPSVDRIDGCLFVLLTKITVISLAALGQHVTVFINNELSFPNRELLCFLKIQNGWVFGLLMYKLNPKTCYFAFTPQPCLPTN